MENIFRYGITVLDEYGFRVIYHIPTGERGKDLWHQREEAEAWLEAAKENSPTQLHMTTGGRTATLRIDQIECWHHGDPIRIILSPDDEKQEAAIIEKLVKASRHKR